MNKLVNKIFDKMSSGQVVYTIGIMSGIAITQGVSLCKNIVGMWKHLKDESE